MKILHAAADDLCIDSFEALPTEAWCLVGANRSGIDTFFKLLVGEAPELAAEVQVPQNLGVVSFSSQQAVFEAELKKDDSDFLDKIDPGTPARAFLNNPEAHADLIAAFALDQSLDKGYRQLSTGQSRKLMLLAELTRGVSCLAVQAPYEGLDSAACAELDKAFDLCHQRGIQILITVHNAGDVPQWCTHVALIAHGRLVHTGPRDEVLDAIKTTLAQKTPDFSASVSDLVPAVNAPLPPDTEPAMELVRLKNGSAGYDGKTVFSGLDLTIRPEDHTLITGPNGCGKSTLLHVITGDHPACYANDLHIFGMRRGSGESIWDIKRHMGIVSPDLHRNYHVPGTTLRCIISGLYDSIGLYNTPTAADEKKARIWLERIGLQDQSDTPFRRLSYADQRLTLIARALIKMPRLLVLDEPTQGLDDTNRKAVLDFLEQVAEERLSTILYVSHRRDEYRDFFTNHVEMS